MAINGLSQVLCQSHGCAETSWVMNIFENCMDKFVACKIVINIIYDVKIAHLYFSIHFLMLNKLGSKNKSTFFIWKSSAWWLSVRTPLRGSAQCPKQTTKNVWLLICIFEVMIKMSVSNTWKSGKILSYLTSQTVWKCIPKGLVQRGKVAYLIFPNSMKSCTL